MEDKKKKTKKYIVADDQDESELHRTSLGDLKAFASLWKFADGIRLKLILAIALILASSVSTIAAARLIGQFVDKGLIAKNLDISIILAAVIVGLEIFTIVVQWGGRVILAKHSSNIILNIRKKLFFHLQFLPMGFYDKRPQGRIVTRVTHDVEGIEDFFTSSLGRFFLAIIMTIMSATAMLVTDFKIGLILILSMLPAVVFISLTRAKVRMVVRRMSKEKSAINSRLSEFLSGMEVIKSHGLEDWSKEHFNRAVADNWHATLAANRLFSWTRPTIAFLCSLPILLLIWFGGRSILEGAMQIGVFVTFIRYCESFIRPVLTLSREIHIVQQAFTGAERIVSFLNELSEADTLGDDGKLKNIEFIGEIKFKNVSMFYNEATWVLNDISLDINPGEVVGFVGTTGCGKTTTVSLLLRLYEFQKGNITFDGTPIREFDRDFLRQSIGFVSQDVVIFRGSLRNNLTSAESFTDQQIISACKETGLWEVMRGIGLRFDTLILEEGANLSVGERQLIALTRIFLKNPFLLILDEATANIDPHHEEIIHAAVERLMKDRTCIIIAHRMDTIRKCNKLFVFKDGKIIESGSIDHLISKNGEFSKLTSSN